MNILDCFFPKFSCSRGAIIARWWSLDSICLVSVLVRKLVFPVVKMFCIPNCLQCLQNILVPSNSNHGCKVSHLDWKWRTSMPFASGVNVLVCSSKSESSAESEDEKVSVVLFVKNESFHCFGSVGPIPIFAFEGISGKGKRLDTKLVTCACFASK